MDRLWYTTATIARLAVWCGGAMLFLAAGIVTAEVALRKLIPSVIGFTGDLFAFLGLAEFASTFARWETGMQAYMFSGSDEISGYLFAVGTTWSMAHALCTRGHIRIDAVYGNFSPRIRGILDVISLAVLGIFVAVMLYRAWDLTSLNLIEYNRSNTNLRIPLAWAQIPWLAGILLFAFALLVAVLRTTLALLRGDHATVAATAGVATQDEEIESELKGLGIQRPQH